MKMIAFAKVDEQGKLTLNNKRTFLREIQAFSGRPIVMTIEKKSKQRSVQQNRYYWGVVLPIVCEGLHDVGYKMTTLQVHEYLKGMFLKTTLANEQNGQALELVKSTSELSTTLMMDYFAEIQQFAAEQLGCIIPDPNEHIDAETPIE